MCSAAAWRTSATSSRGSGPWPTATSAARRANAAPAKGRRKAKRTVVTLKAVRQLRPTRTEIIVCTGLRIKGGVQIWGDIATGLFCDRKQKR